MGSFADPADHEVGVLVERPLVDQHPGFAVGMMTRAIVVMGVIFVVALSDPWVGLAAALTYGLAYTVELILSLVSYFGNPPL